MTKKSKKPRAKSATPLPQAALDRILTALRAAGYKVELPDNVKGICASTVTNRIYICTTRQLMCLDLLSEKLLWEKTYDAGCDRMARSIRARAPAVSPSITRTHASS